MSAARAGERVAPGGDAGAVARELGWSSELERTGDLILSTVLRLLRVRRAVLHTLDRSGQRLVSVAAAGEGDPARWLGQEFPAQAGVSGLAVAERRPVWSSDLLGDPRIRLVHWARQLLLDEDHRAGVAAPLIARGEVLGTLFLGDRAGRVFTEDDLRVLSAFADHAAVALENARLHARALARVAQLSGLVEVSRAVTQTLDYRGVVRTVLEAAETLLPDSAGSLWEFLPDAGELRLLEMRGFKNPAGRPDRQRLGEGVIGGVAVTRAPAVVTDLLEDDRVLFKAWLADERLVSSVVLPLLHAGELYGALHLSTRSRHEFTADEMGFLESFAAQAAAAIANARLYARAEQGRREAEVLAELTRGINASLDLGTVLHRVAEAARELCQADLARIALRKPGSEEMGFHYWAGTFHAAYRDTVIEPGKGLGGQVLLTGKPFRTDDYANDPRITKDYVDAARGEGLLAVMGVPIRADGHIRGLLFVDSRSQRSFSDAEEAVLLRLADHAAVAVHNAQLYEQAQRARADLEAAQEKLVRGETLRALGELAGGAAHHLNNLLAIVSGRVQLLLMRETDPARRRPFEIIDRAARDAADVVRRLQQFARTEPAGRLERVDLNELAGEVVEMARGRWHDAARARGLRIEVEVKPAPIPPVHGDPVALREVLMNLVLNAVDALPAGGTIALETRDEGAAVALAVRDSGIGMSDEVRQRAREPFFTTKGVKSTGLGLSMSHGVLKRHGGELSIESAEGAGTTVTVRLPAVRPAAAPPAAAGAAPRTLRVLVVDDTEDVREMLSALLAAQGHSVVQAGGGREALALLEAGEPVDLVLTDLGMPDMNGWELARTVRGRAPEIRIGVITGWGDAPDAPPGGREGVDFVMAKPFSAEELACALAALPAGPAAAPPGG